MGSAISMYVMYVVIVCYSAFTPSYYVVLNHNENTIQMGQNFVLCSFNCHKRNSLHLRLCELIKKLVIRCETPAGPQHKNYVF